MIWVALTGVGLTAVAVAALLTGEIGWAASAAIVGLALLLVGGGGSGRGTILTFALGAAVCDLVVLSAAAYTLISALAGAR